MAQDSWPSPNHSSGAVTEAEYEKIAMRFSDNGVNSSPASTAVVTAGAGLAVDIRSDVYASVRGFTWTSGATGDTLTITSNASGSTRIDRVILRLDRSTWDVRAVVLEGTPGAGAPALTQDQGGTGVYEILLADVTVPDSASSVTVTRSELYIGPRLRPATSTTRNTSPARGEMVYENDTGRVQLWNGSAWELLHEDTGELALSAGFSSWTNLGSAVGRRIGQVVTLRINKKRAESTFSQSDSDGSKLAVVPSTLRPLTRNQFFACTFSNRETGRVEVRTDGEMWVKLNSGDVPVGHTVSLTMTYLRY